MTKNKYNILVIDDDKDILLSLETFLQQHFKLVICCSKPDNAMNYIQKHDFDVVLLDMNFAARRTTGNEGFYWMDKIKQVIPDVHIVFITAYADIELAVKAVKSGATDFIEKPWKNKKLLETILKAVEKKPDNFSKSSGNGTQSFSQSIVRGKSESMLKLWQTLEKAAPSDVNILILGENGTGKEVVAKEVHSLSKRNNESFIKVDLGAIPETLFESELFGYVRGAFTDAKENKPGKFELASGGTLFLDEIGNIPLAMQSKLLSVLQNREIFRLGDNKPTPINVRIIAATNSPLQNMVDSGSFREDLFYRLNTICIQIPSLKERSEDIPIFIESILTKLKQVHNKSYISISRKAIKKLISYKWPGNVRQLENCLENAVILCENQVIEENDLQLGIEKIFNVVETENYYDNERNIVSEAIKKAKGNLSLAASNLGIARTTLYRKMKKYGL